jgi:hypothetical protein
MRAYLRIVMIVSLKAVDKVLMLRARLRLIELARVIFVLDVEQGQECFIPRELS